VVTVKEEYFKAKYQLVGLLLKFLHYKLQLQFRNKILRRYNFKLYMCLMRNYLVPCSICCNRLGVRYSNVTVTQLG
jgi:4'-phosphopantetheinyl transferase EntD